MNLPKTMDEAIVELLKVYENESALEQLSKMNKEDLYQCHFSLGAAIRNNFRMWDANSPLVLNISMKYNQGQLLHADDASFLIIQEFWEVAKKHVPIVLKKGKWLTFYKKNGYEYFHRHNKPNAVAIVAITENNELVLVEQHRVPQDKPVIEIPAGLVDDGETFEQTAIRELLEETGYGDGTIVEMITDVPATPGICSERLAFVVMRDVKKIGKGGGVAAENEFINVLLQPLDNPFLIKVQSPDKYYDLKFFAGLQMAYKWKK